MIGYTPGEMKHRTFPETYVNVSNLEEYSGADILCSPLAMPCKNELMLAKHVREGALLIQLKAGADLPASFADGRMFNFIERSAEFVKKHHICLKAYQRIVLPIGTYIGYEEDSIKIDGRPYNYMGYHQFLGQVARVGHHGAFIFPYLSNANHLWWCLEMLERHAMELRAEPVKEFVQMSAEMYEASNSPLQELVKVKDGRRLLRALGLSEVDTNALWEYAERNTVKALRFITDETWAKSKHNPTKIKQGKVKNIREKMGLAKGEVL